MGMADSPTKPRGRGSCKFVQADADEKGSGLRAWGDDPEEKGSRRQSKDERSRDESVEPESRKPHAEKHNGHRKSHRLDRPLEEHNGHGRRSDLDKRWRDGADRKRKRSEERRPAKPKTPWVRFDNIPPVAESKHLQQLLTTKTCKVVSCSVKNGSAFVCFEKAESAIETVRQFNGGEMNGRLISVELEFSPPKRSPDRWMASVGEDDIEELPAKVGRADTQEDRKDKKENKQDKKEGKKDKKEKRSRH